MIEWRILVGDVREKLRELPAGSVQTCVTSPPYWGLRDYGTAQWAGGDSECDHVEMAVGMSDKNTLGPDGYLPPSNAANVGRVCQFRSDCGKCGARRVDNQIGLEPTPDAYVQALVEVFREVKRVLRDDGTVWLNLGDSYSNTKAGREDQDIGIRLRGNAGDRLHNKPLVTVDRRGVPDGLKPKDLCGIPWRVAFALQADGWYLRSDIIWSKPNPMPESVTDRPTKAHEYLFLLSKRASYYYDSDAIAELAQDRPQPNPEDKQIRRHGTAWHDNAYAPGASGFGHGYDGKRNKRSVWHVATQPYPEAHFATYPEKLIEPCILAGTSEKGQCPQCGAPWARVVDRPHGGATQGFRPDPRMACPTGKAVGSNTRGMPMRPVLGESWQPSCACDAGEPVPQLVLDPFCGSGTTGAVAVKHGRSFVGVELNPAYVELARQRIGNAGPLFAREQSA
jgi:DNA modification methylase